MRADPALTWYGLAVTAGREIAVKKDLRNTSLNLLIPMSSGWHRVSWRCKRLALLPRPVLPGYLFAGCRGPFDFDALEATRGYCEPVRLPGRFDLSVIPAEQIQRVIDLTIKLDAMVPARHRRSNFRAGEAVQFASGDPFAGERARVMKVLKDELIEIEHKFFGSMRRSQVKVTRLEHVPQQTLAVSANQ